MIRRIIRTLLVLGFLGGLAGGLVAAAAALSAQRYLSQGRWRLAWLTAIDRLDQGALLGLGAAVLVIVLGAVLRFLWKTAFAPYWKLEARTIKLPPLLRILRPPFVRTGRAAAAFVRRSIGPEDSVPKRPVVLAAVIVAMNLVVPLRDLIAPIRGPNILVVVADALRPDHLGCYGSNAGLSPNIDGAAQEALVFDQARSAAPWTKPSIGSLMTSLSPREHGAYYFQDSLRPGLLTLAEVFRDRGYATFGVQKNSCVGPDFGFGQGFEAYVDTVRDTDADMFNILGRRIDRAGRRPFFAYLHFMNTHVPYPSDAELGPEFRPGEDTGIDIRVLTRLGLSEADKDRIRGRYDQAVRATDVHFGTLLAMLRERGLEGRTIVVLTADHGEELWDHGDFEHCHTLYDELLRVPLIIRGPGRLPARRETARTQLIDLYPLLLGLAGIDIPAGIRGRNFLPALLAGRTPEPRDFFFEGLLFGPARTAVLRDRWKLIDNQGEESPKALPLLGPLTPYWPERVLPPYELYDLEADPKERTNVADAYPDVIREMKRRLDLFKSARRGVPPPPPRSKTKEETDKLRSLGYFK